MFNICGRIGVLFYDSPPLALHQAPDLQTLPRVRKNTACANQHDSPFHTHPHHRLHTYIYEYMHIICVFMYNPPTPSAVERARPYLPPLFLHHGFPSTSPAVFLFFLVRTFVRHISQEPASKHLFVLVRTCARFVLHLCCTFDFHLGGVKH